jgi:hypothetical protein
MVDSNEQLIIKLKTITARLPKIIDDAGSMLVRNIRSQARIAMGNGSKYPFEFQNDFQNAETVTYNPTERIVVVAHPAAKVLEYGLKKELTITPKKGEFLRFIGEDGEEVFRREVKIKPKKPLGYAKKAIKETKKDLAKRFKEVING